MSPAQIEQRRCEVVALSRESERLSIRQAQLNAALAAELRTLAAETRHANRTQSESATRVH